MSGLQSGQWFGQYQLVSQIGQGGMASVWKAYHAAMKRNVAIKILQFQFARSPEFLARFQQEIQLIGSLEHPHILPVYDCGESQGLPFLVMRLLEYGNLKARIQGRRLTFADIDRIFSQLAQALSYAHSRGVIHRDVKPSNVMIDDHGDAFLTDFGVAKLIDDTHHLTVTGALTGTPAYMSPEQAQGQKLDHRSDIYSLAIVLYEMLTGQVPFDAETPMAILLMKIQNPLPRPTLLNPQVSSPVEAVLMKALATDPSQRYDSMPAFLSAWKGALSQVPVALPGQPSLVDTQSPGEHPSTAKSTLLSIKSYRRLWPWAVGGMVGLCLLLTILALALPKLPVLINAFGSRMKTTPILTAQSLFPLPASVTPTQPSSETLPIPTFTASATIFKPSLTPTFTLIPPSNTLRPSPSSTPTLAAPEMTALENMFCREGPDTSYRDNLTVHAGEVYPVLARWSNDWLLISVNQPEITRSRCCWVGGDYKLNVPPETIRLISTVPDRMTCQIP